jgi:DNA-binding NtrC family response regulator
VDVRVVATTNIRIEDQVREGKFRKDLYYRLNVIPLRIPPLRERASDITPLALFFLEKYSSENGSFVNAFAPDALRKLKEHSWPGNVRELQNVVQRAVLISESPTISQDNIILDMDEQDTGAGSELALMPLSELEKMMIHKALSTYDGNRTKAAEILGISVRTLRNKLHEYRQSIGM